MRAKNMIRNLKLLLAGLLTLVILAPDITLALPKAEKEAIDKNAVHYVTGGVGNCTVGSASEDEDGSTTVCCSTENGGTQNVTIPKDSKGSNGEKLFVFLIQKKMFLQHFVQTKNKKVPKNTRTLVTFWFTNKTY